ncbi:DNA-binding response regulator [Dactylosporangium sp. CA-233914]|uniref:helix-turn-helix transcriptional regulator n=1 Tax=Dactylosporangium sp. CA-233914 TaxID=3239934 RepID=UPI003D935A9D
MRLAVIDPLPMYRQGVVSVLSAAGHVVETPDDLLAWLRRGHDGLVLLTLDTSTSWDALGRLRAATNEYPVIAMLAEESAAAGAKAVRAGARSVLPRGTSAAVLTRTVEATAGGQAVLPAEVVAALLSGVASTDRGESMLTAEQRVWLRYLADGMTVARLAEQVGYSERAMFRLLQTLYRRLGARTRIQAIVRAQEQGWLVQDVTDPGLT